MSDSTVTSGEFKMTANDSRQIAAIMREETGVVLDDSKINLIYSRLAKRLRALGLASFSEYCDLISQPQGEVERGAMIAALTTNVTRFFREPHHFEHLKNVILPPLIAQVKHGGKIRLWSAACSSGQEPFSMALTVLSLLPEAANYDVKILASDIDPNMIAAGTAGVYDTSLMADIPQEMSRRWFAPAPGRPGVFSVGPELRSLVSFKKLNLIADWPMRARFQAIFCRNVVIYFDDTTKNQIWDRMVRLLEDDGALYIGHSERVGGQAEQKLRNDGITTYRLRGEGAPRTPATKAVHA
jgi:chemotaxis protein methyltransferase CheR